MRLARPAPWVLIIGLVLVGVVVSLRLLVFRPAASLPGSAYNRGANAVWLGIEWVNEPHHPDEIAALAARLQALQMRDAYVYVSYLRPSGQFGPTYDYAASFTQAFKAAAPTIRLHAWLGLPLATKRGGPLSPVTPAGYVDLSDPEVRRTIATFAVRLCTEAGFDGIHLDPEPVLDDDADLLSLLDDVRQSLRLRVGPMAVFSVATPRIWPGWLSDLAPPGLVAWSATYYRQVANRVDQVALMTYDSVLPLPWLYRQWTRYEVVALSQALDGLGTDVLIGIPVSQEQTWTHHPSAETMASGLRGTIDGLNDAAARPHTITGVAIYPDWEATDPDWNEYRHLWLGPT